MRWAAATGERCSAFPRLASMASSPEKTRWNQWLSCSQGSGVSSTEVRGVMAWVQNHRRPPPRDLATTTA